METHSSILTWEIPWTEEPGGLQSMGLPRVEYQLSDQDYIYDLYTFPKTMFLICLQSKKKKKVLPMITVKIENEYYIKPQSVQFSRSVMSNSL